jgi:hypothetical protein
MVAQLVTKCLAFTELEGHYRVPVNVAGPLSRDK